MTTLRETITDAVYAAIATALPSARVERNADAPIEVPAGGHVIVRDVAPEEDDRTLGVVSYTFRLPVSVEIYAVAASAAARSTALDQMCTAASAAVIGDATLSLLALSIDPRLDERQTLSDDGAQTIEAALLSVGVLYETTSPIG